MKGFIEVEYQDDLGIHIKLINLSHIVAINKLGSYPDAVTMIEIAEGSEDSEGSAYYYTIKTKTTYDEICRKIDEASK